MFTAERIASSERVELLLFDKVRGEILASKDKMYTLSGTEFDMRKQFIVWLDSVELDEAREKNKWDLVGYYFEYLKSGPLLPIFADVVHGRFVANRYGGVPYADVVSSDERGGVVKASISYISKEIPKANLGKAFVLVSPGGWSGMKDDSGDEIRFAESQIYMFRINETGEFEGLTLRTDMNLRENEELLRRLGAVGYFDENDSEMDRVMKVVGTPVMLESATFENIVDVIAKVMNRENVIVDEFGIKSFETVREMLANRKLICEVDDFIWEVIGQFEEEVGELTGQWSREEIKKWIIANGRCVLRMYDALYGDRAELNERKRHAVAHTAVQQISRCGGRGVRSKKGGKEGWKYGFCRICGSYRLVGSCGICEQCELNFN